MRIPCTSDATAPGPDAFATQDRLQALFSCFGQVRRLDLVRTDQGQGQAPRLMCFLQMSSPDEEEAVVDALGLGRFGGDLVMVLPPLGAPAAMRSGTGPASVACGWPWPD